MPLSDATRDEIHAYFVTQMTRYIKQALATPRHKPFHERLMPLLSSVPYSERSFSTRLGIWFQNMAKLVAAEYNQQAHSNYAVEGNIQPAASAHINTILDLMDHGNPRRIPNRVTDIAQVSSVQSPGGAATQVRSDLYVKTHEGLELYFEIKTPDPNKRTCRDMKKDILTIMALRSGSNAQAYAACGYNPLGDQVPYSNQFVPQFLEIGQDILVGRQFWERIGEQGTYDELLQIASDVGRHVEHLMIDAKT